jgi:hypothetical protein
MKLEKYLRRGRGSNLGGGGNGGLHAPESSGRGDSEVERN